MKTNLNLLPVSVLRRQTLGKAVRGWAYAVGFVALVAIAATIYQQRRTAAVECRHGQLQKSYEATHATLESVKQLRRQLETIEDRQGIALTLASEKPVVSLLGLFSQAALHNGGGVAIEHFVFFSDLAPAPTPSGEGRVRVELRGVASDAVALAEFVAAIRQWNLFRSVELKASAARTVGDTSVRSFTMECIH